MCLQTDCYLRKNLGFIYSVRHLFLTVMLIFQYVDSGRVERYLLYILITVLVKQFVFIKTDKELLLQDVPLCACLIIIHLITSKRNILSYICVPASSALQQNHTITCSHQIWYGSPDSLFSIQQWFFLWGFPYSLSYVVVLVKNSEINYVLNCFPWKCSTTVRKQRMPNLKWQFSSL